MTYGPRFSGGYQFPRTHAARLSRGEPIRQARLPGGAIVRIVPLDGGRRRVFDVCSEKVEGERTITSSCLAHDELEASAEFARLVRTLST